MLIPPLLPLISARIPINELPSPSRLCHRLPPSVLSPLPKVVDVEDDEALLCAAKPAAKQLLDDTEDALQNSVRFLAINGNCEAPLCPTALAEQLLGDEEEGREAMELEKSARSPIIEGVFDDQLDADYFDPHRAVSPGVDHSGNALTPKLYPLHLLRGEEMNSFEDEQSPRQQEPLNVQQAVSASEQPTVGVGQQPNQVYPENRDWSACKFEMTPCVESIKEDPQTALGVLDPGYTVDLDEAPSLGDIGSVPIGEQEKRLTPEGTAVEEDNSVNRVGQSANTRGSQAVEFQRSCENGCNLLSQIDPTCIQESVQIDGNVEKGRCSFDHVNSSHSQLIFPENVRLEINADFDAIDHTCLKHATDGLQPVEEQRHEEMISANSPFKNGRPQVSPTSTTCKPDLSELQDRHATEDGDELEGHLNPAPVLKSNHSPSRGADERLQPRERFKMSITKVQDRESMEVSAQIETAVHRKMPVFIDSIAEPTNLDRVSLPRDNFTLREAREQAQACEQLEMILAEMQQVHTVQGSIQLDEGIDRISPEIIDLLAQRDNKTFVYENHSTPEAIEEGAKACQQIEKSANEMRDICPLQSEAAIDHNRLKIVDLFAESLISNQVPGREIHSAPLGKEDPFDTSFAEMLHFNSMECQNFNETGSGYQEKNDVFSADVAALTPPPPYQKVIAPSKPTQRILVVGKRRKLRTRSDLDLSPAHHPSNRPQTEGASDQDDEKESEELDSQMFSSPVYSMPKTEDDIPRGFRNSPPDAYAQPSPSRVPRSDKLKATVPSDGNYRSPQTGLSISPGDSFSQPHDSDLGNTRQPSPILGIEPERGESMEDQFLASAGMDGEMDDFEELSTEPQTVQEADANCSLRDVIDDITLRRDDCVQREPSAADEFLLSSSTARMIASPQNRNFEGDYLKEASNCATDVEDSSTLPMQLSDNEIEIRTATTEPMSEAETAIVYDSSPALEAANELPLPPLPPLRQQHRPHLTRRCLSPNELTSQVQTPIGRYNSPRRAASVVARQSISLSLQALFTPTRVGEEPRSSSSCSSVRNARHGSPDEREGLEYCSQVLSDWSVDSTTSADGLHKLLFRRLKRPNVYEQDGVSMTPQNISSPTYNVASSGGTHLKRRKSKKSEKRGTSHRLVEPLPEAEKEEEEEEEEEEEDEEEVTPTPTNRHKRRMRRRRREAERRLRCRRESEALLQDSDNVDNDDDATPRQRTAVERCSASQEQIPKPPLKPKKRILVMDEYTISPEQITEYPNDRSKWKAKKEQRSRRLSDNADENVSTTLQLEESGNDQRRHHRQHYDGDDDGVLFVRRKKKRRHRLEKGGELHPLNSNVTPRATTPGRDVMAHKRTKKRHRSSLTPTTSPSHHHPASKKHKPIAKCLRHPPNFL